MKKGMALAILLTVGAMPLTVSAKENSTIEIQKIEATQSTAEKTVIDPKDYIPVLMYHHFKTEDVPAGDGANMTIQEFEEQLQTLQEAGYTTLFLSELYQILENHGETGNGEKALGLDKKYVVITIDDGYRSNYELAYPLLQKYHMKANISVITSRIHKGYIFSTKEIEKMSWENLNEMQNSGLIEIYNHTSDHKPVGERLYTDVRQSILEGEQALNENLQQRSGISVLTYPNGQYTQMTKDFLRSMLEFDLQLTTDSGVVTGETSIKSIPRITVNSGTTGEQLLERIEMTAAK